MRIELFVALGTLAATVGAQVPTLNRVVVEGRAEGLVGDAASASEGKVGQSELRRRPLLRVGEVLETVPGLIVTQHSGAGKANQFFLRGFNLDHGTDLATSVVGMPVNMPSHGHGQGYTDLNFMIPELIETVRFRKGPYSAQDGDFASAGAVDIDYVGALDRALLKVEAGSFEYGRALLADSVETGDGALLYAVEVGHSDGPWRRRDDYDRANGVVSYRVGERDNGFRVIAMGHDGTWNATDQIPRRASIDRFDTLDRTSGGAARRLSLAADWRSSTEDGVSEVRGYVVGNEFELFSNFTYLLEDPVRGDQFEQADRRLVYGLEARHTGYHSLAGLDVETEIGAEVRWDSIDNSLHRNQRRRRVSRVRSDAIQQRSVGFWGETEIVWSSWLRSTAGLRVDHISFDVDGDTAGNSARRNDWIASPKLGVALGPWHETEIYWNGGYGFHSNDARGTGAPLVRTKGTEVGVRTTALQGLQSTVAVWGLESDSELVFVGDAGTTEAGRGARRFGIELANHYRPTNWLTVDLDLSASKALFRDRSAGRRVPNAMETTAQAGVSVHRDGYLAALRMRHFGARALNEDNVRSSSTTLFNARLGYEVSANTGVSLDVLNLFDAKGSDIEYFYASRLPGEGAAGVEDVHFHPVEPLTLRLVFEARF